MGQFSMTDKDVPFGTAGGFGGEVTGGFGSEVSGWRQWHNGQISAAARTRQRREPEAGSYGRGHFETAGGDENRTCQMGADVEQSGGNVFG